jgi:transcriptional regulator with XRE-family HTH domain
MTSFSPQTDKRRRTFVRLIGEIRHVLNEALAEEHSRRDLTKADIAKILGVNKSFVGRKLSGESNMTLATLADLAYALDRNVKITLPSRHVPAGSNQFAGPPRPPTTDARIEAGKEVTLSVSAF